MAGFGQEVKDGGQPIGAGHDKPFAGSGYFALANSVSKRADSSTSASRPALMYFRESTTAGLASRYSRTARVKNPFKCVDTLILVIPAPIAATSISSVTPEEPCRTSGFPTADFSRVIRCRSSAALRSVME